MPKCRADADNRRFFDEFESVRVSRLRATGVIDPAKRQAVIPFPGGKQKLIGDRGARGAAMGFHNAKSGLCFPSYETIAEAAGCARSTNGYISTIRRRNGGER
jgi:hypothetical protein